MTTTPITIIGDGQMGLVLADALCQQGLPVRLWGPFPEDVEALGASRRSPRIKGFELPAEVAVHADAGDAFAGCTLAFNAIPTQFIRATWSDLVEHLPSDTPVVSVSKGVEIDTLLRPTQIITDAAATAGATCVLSGPTIATELAARNPAAMVASSEDAGLSARVQELLAVPWLRIYTHNDPIGVELAGATKNVIALAAGMCDGLALGDNAKSALLARGLAEICRLGTAMGARLETFFGIAGVGDLATTCFSPHGRNRTCGERLGRGESLADIEVSMGSVIEGVATSRAVARLAEEQGVDMPITAAVFGILFEGVAPRQAIADLMGRDLRAEQLGSA